MLINLYINQSSLALVDSIFTTSLQVHN